MSAEIIPFGLKPPAPPRPGGTFAFIAGALCATALLMCLPGAEPHVAVDPVPALVGP